MPCLSLPISVHIAAASGVPLWQTALLDQPWIGATLALATGIIAGVFIHRSGRSKVAGLSIAIGAISATGIMAIGLAVTTPEAMLRERTERFVAAIASARPDKLEPMLGPRLVLTSRGASELDLGAEWLLGVTAGMDRAIRSNDMTVLAVEMQGRSTARVRFRCRTIVAINPQPVASTWEVHWQRFEGTGPDAWKAVRLEGLTIYGQDAGNQWISWGSGYRVHR